MMLFAPFAEENLMTLRSILRQTVLTVPPIRRLASNRDFYATRTQQLDALATSQRAQIDQAIADLRAATHYADETRAELEKAKAELEHTKQELAQLKAQATEAAPARTSVLDLHSTEFPGHKAALGLFDGTWSSDVPGYGFGTIKLFEDHRMIWVAEQFGDLKGKRVLELGPLEGGHTYMLAKMGAHVTSIESNSKAFLKCLTVQNALKFETDFLFGDFCKYLSSTNERFDLIVASGVLYHMVDPIRLLQDMAAAASSFFIWTHYYNPEVTASNPALTPKFDASPTIVQCGTRTVHMHKQFYLDALKWDGFSGGAAPFSYWLTRESLLGVIEDLGFTVTANYDHTQHPNGASIALFARKKSA
jgi:hypothetical protein